MKTALVPGGIPSPRVLRRKVDHLENILSLLKHGELISPTHLFRRCRFLENAMCAKLAYHAHEENLKDPPWDGHGFSSPEWNEAMAAELKSTFRSHFESLPYDDISNGAVENYYVKMKKFFHP